MLKLGWLLALDFGVEGCGDGFVGFVVILEAFDASDLFFVRLLKQFFNQLAVCGVELDVVAPNDDRDLFCVIAEDFSFVGLEGCHAC